MNGNRKDIEDLRISIIVPVYNAAPYLERCIASIIGQTYQRWECIIVDDVSDDGSAQLVRTLTAGDPRFTILELSQHRGAAWARNAGLKVAHGDALCFVDADDWCDALMLEYMVSRAAAFPQVGRIITPAVVHNEMNGDRYIWRISPLGIMEASSPFPFADHQCDIGHVTGCLYVLRNIPYRPTFPRVRVFEDMIFNMALLFAGVTSLVCEVSVYHYTRHQGSLIEATTLTNAESLQALAALAYQDTIWNPHDSLYRRCYNFLQAALNGKMKRF